MPDLDARYDLPRQYLASMAARIDRLTREIEAERRRALKFARYLVIEPSWARARRGKTLPTYIPNLDSNLRAILAGEIATRVKRRSLKYE